MKETGKVEAKMSGKTKSELTEAEWSIMKVVWKNQPCAAGTVQDAADTGAIGFIYGLVRLGKIRA